MQRIRTLWRNFVDIREGELGRTVWMMLYLVLVLIAYYILKPVSRAVFLNNMPLSALPVLYILIAIVGGIIAYWYTKAAIQISLKAAIQWTMGLTVVSLLVIWWLLPYGFHWMYYVFNVWVSLFGIILVSQGWLIAANVFDSREAKRLYGILGSGAIIGAALGGTFTAVAVRIVGTNNLLLVSALLVILCYGAYRMVAVQPGVDLGRAKGAEEEDSGFTFNSLLGSLQRVRHLQVIVGIILLTYLVDQLIEYQFNVAASRAYQGDDLTSFLGGFLGLYLNLVSIVFQVFVTAAVVRAFGVGGTLQIMPALMAILSVGVMAAPGLWAAGIARLSEAALRYSLNRTGMELLYLPLPQDLKNRTKAFVDIFVDRAGRGIAGVLLMVLGSVAEADLRQVAVMTAVFALAWLGLSVVARREYVQTIRSRLQARRLNLEDARVNVEDPAVIQQLEEAALGENERQAAYALGALRAAAAYNSTNLLGQLAGSPHPAVRTQTYEMARERKDSRFLSNAASEFDHPETPVVPELLTAAARYVYALSQDWRTFAGRWMDHADCIAARAAVEALTERAEEAADVIGREWLTRAAEDVNPARRILAARAIGVRGDHGTEALFDLLRDPDPAVAGAACESAGRLNNRTYAELVIARLGSSRTRGKAITALAALGPRIGSLLEEKLRDPNVAELTRRQIPRVMAKVGSQQNVEILLRALAEEENPLVRAAALKGLNKMRDAYPELNFGADTVTAQILSEARRYYELYAALEPLKASPAASGRPAVALLIRSLEERLTQTLERLFRLLGLRYPPREIHTAYQAWARGRKETLAAAIDFLDSVLDRDVKRVVLPLLDDAGRLLDSGFLLFGITVNKPEEAVLELIRGRDTWLCMCAMAAAPELQIEKARGELRKLEQSGYPESARVAEWALARY